MVDRQLHLWWEQIYIQVLFPAATCKFLKPFSCITHTHIGQRWHGSFILWAKISIMYPEGWAHSLLYIFYVHVNDFVKEVVLVSCSRMSSMYLMFRSCYTWYGVYFAVCAVSTRGAVMSPTTSDDYRFLMTCFKLAGVFFHFGTIWSVAGSWHECYLVLYALSWRWWLSKTYKGKNV